MLLVDTNILVRCSHGRAILRIQALKARDVLLATTDRNAEEFGHRLIEIFGWEEEKAWVEVMRVLDGIEIVEARDYEHHRETADRRLHEGGKSDWPALAAAIALDASIWSDDRDFFGVGIPVWSTANVRFVASNPMG